MRLICLMRPAVKTWLAWAVVVAFAADLPAQSLTIPEMLKQQSQWATWAQNGTKLQLEGRYEGRTAEVFRLARLPSLTFQPPRNNPLPEKMQAGQRIEVSGRLRAAAERLVFEVNRLTIGETDVERLQHRVAALPASEASPLYALATEYQAIAEFYDDVGLKAETDAVRLEAFRRERRSCAGNADELWKLADKVRSLGMADRLVTEVQYESMISRMQQKPGDLADLLMRIREHAAGWNQTRLPWDAAREAAWQANPTAAFNQATDPDRLALHRRLFRSVQLQIIEQSAAPDGSNGVAVARQIKELLPEESTAAERYEEREIRFRLERVPRLSRIELQQLTELLGARNRAEEVNTTVDLWLKEQEQRFAATGLEGQLRTADEYLFAGDRWKRIEHQQQGVSLLKQAWETAQRDSPSDAQDIAARLKRLGWERLKDRWMTPAQIEALPGDDVQLAMREGRVVKGMSVEQVLNTLGQPARISRVVSARHVREFWIYDSPGSAGVVVQFQRLRGEATRDARVFGINRKQGR